VITFLFIVDIVLNFFIEYDDADGVLVNNNIKIAKRYIATGFTFDLISTIPYDAIIT